MKPTKTNERTVVHRGDPVDARTPALRCLIVDDQPTTLEQLAWMLRVHPSVRWVSTAADATEALRALRHAEGDFARLHTSDGSHLIRARLTALADCWRNAGWIRIHRSYLVQLRCIADVRVADSKQMTVVVDGHQLPVSRRLAPKLRNRLLNAARMTTLATT